MIADHVQRRQPPAREALDQRAEIVGSVGRFQFRQRAERQAEPVLLSVEFGGDLAAAPVGRHGATVKLMGPADSSAISKVTSPSWLPVYSSAVIWNGPSTVPKLGTGELPVDDLAGKEALIVIVASDCASLKMPDPLIAARCTPLPASSSRQRPAESASVMSTVSLLKAMRLERSPATVTKLPKPLNRS